MEIQNPNTTKSKTNPKSQWPSRKSKESR